MITDEQYIDAYLTTRSYAAAARRLGISRQAIDSKMRRLRGHGIALPETDSKQGNPAQKYSPERIKELNILVAQYDTDKTRQQ